MKKPVRIALTGFMGVGKSSVARHLSNLLRCHRSDLDNAIEEAEGRSVADYIDANGVDAYRATETRVLKTELSRPGSVILSLGGGAWTVPENRECIKRAEFTSIWLESSFEHCWYNIKFSKKERPLARSKKAALKLFEERQKDYCLADVHLVIRPELNSFNVATQIIEEIL